MANSGVAGSNDDDRHHEVEGVMCQQCHSISCGQHFLPFIQALTLTMMEQIKFIKHLNYLVACTFLSGRGLICPFRMPQQAAMD